MGSKYYKISIKTETFKDEVMEKNTNFIGEISEKTILAKKV